MLSQDFYTLLDGWCIYDYLIRGVRKCVVYLKKNQSLSDPILVQYTSGEKETIPGKFIFFSREKAIEQVKTEKSSALLECQHQIDQINEKMRLIRAMYGNVLIID